MSENVEVDADAIRNEFEAAVRGETGPEMFPIQTGSSIKHVIGVVSGKGGVGKSLVCGALATELARQGYQVGILDADITGPSIPKMFGISQERATADITGTFMVPVTTKGGIKIISTNLVLENETDPVLWRGPILQGVLRQFWGETVWGDIDFLLVDMPPGTGDVALSTFQSLPIEGIVVVTSPQDLVQMVVGKAVKMATMMGVEVLGLVENFSYAICPCCGERIELFGSSHVDETVQTYQLPVLAKLPQDVGIAEMCDKGTLEQDLPEHLMDKLVELVSSADSR